MFGVEERIPIISLAKVPELPKFKYEFFFKDKDPKPLPFIEYFLDPILLILTPNFLKHLIVENISSDSRTFSVYEIF